MLLSKSNSRQCLPRLIFILENSASYKKIITALPKKQSIVILRMYNHSDRILLAIELSQICKECQVKLLIAGDPNLAKKIKADGIHISDTSFFNLRSWRNKMPNWIITATAHNFQRLLEIKNYGLTAAIYSPIFPTNSHPGKKNIGILRFMKDINKLDFPVYALGGINKNNITRLKHAKIIGIAGINMFTDFLF